MPLSAKRAFLQTMKKEFTHYTVPVNSCKTVCVQPGVKFSWNFLSWKYVHTWETLYLRGKSKSILSFVSHSFWWLFIFCWYHFLAHICIHFHEDYPKKRDGKGRRKKEMWGNDPFDDDPYDDVMAHWLLWNVWEMTFSTGIISLCDSPTNFPFSEKNGKYCKSKKGKKLIEEESLFFHSLSLYS